MKKYRVKEIFGPTLQGEGAYVGTPCFFLRFAGCNKWNGRADSKPASICNYCDTDFVGGELMTWEEIVETLDGLLSHHENVQTLVISGGEPAMQVDHQLCFELAKMFDLHLETNGSIDIKPEVADLFTHITISPKQNFVRTIAHPFGDSFKFLYPWVGDEIDPISFNKDYYDLTGCELPEVYIQPIERNGETPHMKEVIDLCLKHNWRLSKQIHKELALK